MQCLIVGRGRRHNDLGVALKNKFNACTFLSLHEDEGPDIVGQFETLEAKQRYQTIYLDMDVQEFLLNYEGETKNYKGVPPGNNKRVVASLLRNLKVGGAFYIPLARRFEDDQKYRKKVVLTYRLFNKISENKFLIHAVPGVYPLFAETPQWLSRYYVKMTRVEE